MAKALKYGPVAAAHAYADFTEHPPYYRRSLEVAGITPRDIPKRGLGNTPKSSADMAMLMDIIDCLLDRPSVQTLVLMTGDSDFIRISARARHRFGKRVIIAGVPGTVSGDLVASADGVDYLVPEDQPTEEERQLIKLIDWLEQSKPYLTFTFLRDYAMSPKRPAPLTFEQATALLNRFKEKQVLLDGQTVVEDRTLPTCSLNREHQWVKAVLKV
jgi:hypothetical protein